MKRKAAVLPLLAVPLFVMTSCGSTAVTENTIELKKDGKVVEYIVEDFEASYYDADELKSFIDAQVEAYLEDSDGSIKVSKDKVEDDVAYVTITYDSADTYADFTGTVLYVGDVLQAQTAGYDFDTDFISADDADAAAQDEEDSSAEAEEEEDLSAEEETAGEDSSAEEEVSTAEGETEEDSSAEGEDSSAAEGEDASSEQEETEDDTVSEIEGVITVASPYISGSEILEEDELNVLIINTDVTVIVQGTIKYVSASGATIVDSSTVSVQIPDGADGLVYIIYE